MGRFCPGRPREQQDKFQKEKDDDSEWRIDIDLDEDGWTNGVRLTDGDGTVPLISLGLQCRKCAAALLVQLALTPVQQALRPYACAAGVGGSPG